MSKSRLLMTAMTTTNAFLLAIQAINTHREGRNRTAFHRALVEVVSWWGQRAWNFQTYFNAVELLALTEQAKCSSCINM